MKFLFRETKYFFINKAWSSPVLDVSDFVLLIMKLIILNKHIFLPSLNTVGFYINEFWKLVIIFEVTNNMNKNKICSYV